MANSRQRIRTTTPSRSNETLLTDSTQSIRFGFGLATAWPNPSSRSATDASQALTKPRKAPGTWKETTSSVKLSATKRSWT